MDDADPESNTKVLTTRFPLFVIRSEWLASPNSLAPVWEYLAWSCNVMHLGVFPATGFHGGPAPTIPCWGLDQQAPGDPLLPEGRTCRLIEIRADWKGHVQSFRLKHYYTCNRICHQCLASRTDPSYPYTDFVCNPKWLRSVRTNRQFLLEEISDPLNMLVYVAKFHYTVLKWDYMHSVNLGCGLHANGGAWFELLKVNWFGNGEKHVQFRNGYRKFKQFLKVNNVESSQPLFKPWMLITTGEEYCFFASKVGSFATVYDLENSKNMYKGVMFYSLSLWRLTTRVY